MIEPLKENDMIDILIEMSKSTGHYGRILDALVEFKENDNADYKALMKQWEREKFLSRDEFLNYLQKECD